ncbi:LexA family protein [Pontibacillus litoralis]|uniref:XRE family transcriptional regulator n=1 Tax=Pontibacillus litoralis JSM 072002 TaxID=1385512 RepID=A0A0A5G042_9BACI|nr:XRE family transcriptional regulator [Pontibacillus litoralis]KGX84453.1 XRE family transcriptional regulator [Pontibacillus litoralis JSM 072002]
MKIGDRIRKRRKELKLSVDQLAEMLGKNRATIYRYESNEIENMPIYIIQPLAEALGLSPAYLMGWEEDDEENTTIKETTSTYNYFPQSISAGLPLRIDGMIEESEVKVPNSIMGKWAGDHDIFMLKVNGESMNKIIPHGSLIAVKPIESHNLKEGDIVVYSDGGDYSVKHYFRDGERIIFKPSSHDQRFYDYITNVDNDSLEIHGKVVVYIVELD